MARKQRKGSLTDEEVGIARNLFARGNYRNQDILGLINSVRRLDGLEETNGGRISEVKTGKPRYQGIMAASDEVTDAYLERAKNPSGYERIDTDPLRKEELDALFPLAKGRTDRLAITETDRIECKEGFNVHWAKHHIRPIMAFANNKGGYLVFGVKDKTWEIKGIDRSKFEKMDRKDATQAILHNLSSAVDFDTALIERGDKAVGIIYISPASATLKPVMAINQNNDAKTSPGQIYYRYQAENNLIRPAELQRIIEERIRGLSETILSKHLHNILSNGIENSAVLNLDTGDVDGKAGSFVIDESLLPQLRFIKEGEFVEKSGAPALKLIGEIKSAGNIVTTRKEDLLRLYPYSYREMEAEVKKKAPRIKQNEINTLIKNEKLKDNDKYSAYVFRNNKQAENYKKTGSPGSGTPSIFNQAAIDFIVRKLAPDEINKDATKDAQQKAR